MMTKLEKRLSRRGAFLMLTHGEGYATNDGKSVRRSEAEKLQNLGLFTEEMCVQKYTHRLISNNDGLFPDTPQTWVYGK